jgi:hypothetical protein
VTLTAVALFGCSGDVAAPTGPLEQAAARQRLVHRASGNIRFFIPADFNGGIFGGAVDNRLSFNARRDAAGKVSGHWDYTQTDFGGGGIPYRYVGSVTCFKVYDTPVLERFPNIPAKTGNRAKWGGPIEQTDDPTVAVGTFAWFNSIDNGTDDQSDGENAETPPDLSSIFGLGNEAANEAFCNSDRVPNPNFGPHAVRGDIEVR